MFHFTHQVGLPATPIAAHGLGREHGIAAHKLLQLTPLHLVGTPKPKLAPGDLHKAERLDANVVSLVEHFWNSDFGRELAANAKTLHRELPFALRLRGRPDLVLRGQIDLLLERENEIIVIEYKTTARTPLETHRFQLGCYALAARRFTNDTRPIRTGVIFLLEDSLEPVFEEFHLEERELLSAATEFAEAQRSGEWAGRRREVCVSLGCGYIDRCHP
jgi:ATP-dependent exoDNAse (exonuclease V) beta subunit